MSKYYKKIENKTGLKAIYKEKPIVQLFPNFSVIIGDKFQFNQHYFNDAMWNSNSPNILDSVFRDTFNQKTTILFISNNLCISMSPDFSDPKFINNNFWVSAIQNMNGEKFDISYNPNSYWVYTNAEDEKATMWCIGSVILNIISTMFLVLFH